MAKKSFWEGFGIGAAAGAAAGFGTWLLTRSLGREEFRKIMRLEKSVQIGRPVNEVFRAWADLQRLPEYLSMLDQVQVRGHRSQWRGRVAGRPVEWDAELIQDIPNQALGWKSVSGPKHTGRIDFSPVGDNTIVHVVINYAPRGGMLARAAAEALGPLEGYVEQALRDFKAALEGRGQEPRATGTYGESAYVGEGPSPGMQTSRYGGEFGGADRENPVERPRPTKPSP